MSKITRESKGHTQSTASFCGENGQTPNLEPWSTIKDFAAKEIMRGVPAPATVHDREDAVQETLLTLFDQDAKHLVNLTSLGSNDAMCAYLRQMGRRTYLSQGRKKKGQHFQFTDNHASLGAESSAEMSGQIDELVDEVISLLGGENKKVASLLRLGLKNDAIAEELGHQESYVRWLTTGAIKAAKAILDRLRNEA